MSNKTFQITKDTPALKGQLAVILCFLVVSSHAQKFHLTHKQDKDINEEFQGIGEDSIYFEISKKEIMFGLVRFEISEHDLTFNKNGGPIYMYYTGSYPNISSSTKIWMVSESDVKGVWIIAYADPINDTNSYSAGGPMEKQIGYLGKKVK